MFSNFMVLHHPDYPAWSDFDGLHDQKQLNAAGNGRYVRVMKKPELFYNAYQEFKRNNKKSTGYYPTLKPSA